MIRPRSDKVDELDLAPGRSPVSSSSSFFAAFAAADRPLIQLVRPSHFPGRLREVADSNLPKCLLEHLRTCIRHDISRRGNEPI